jgi:aryl-alcohol dehydrogenase-like predicted oxidoreductase
VRYSVASGFPPWRVVDSLHRSVARNHARFEALQGEYSLITRAPFEAEALGMCREYRLGFMARSPLAGGFLAKRPLSIRESINLDRSWQSERFGSTTSDAVLRILAEIAGKRDASPAQIALAWVLRNPQVTSALVSAPSAPELRNLLRASEIILSDGENLALEDVTVVPDYRTELRHA